MQYFISPQFFETLIIFAVGCCIILGGRAFDEKIVKSKGSQQKRLKSVKIVVDIFKYMIFLMLLYIALSVNGINVDRVMRNLGIAGIVVGFALNDFLQDIVMGITIMIEGYFKVGDSVVFEDEIGKVVAFNIKTTRIFLYRTEETLMVCNRNISSIKKASDWVDIDIPIGYDIDPQYARAICKKCAKRIERLKYVYSCDFLNTQNFNSSHIAYRLRIHHLIEKQYMVRRNANSVVQDVFKEHDLAFPYEVTVLYSGEKLESKYQNRPVEYILSENHVDKGDYEIGHGADSSKIIPFDGSADAFTRAIKEAERYSLSENLNKKMMLRIRLLSEEALSMTQSINIIRDGSFHIERSEADYEIIFDATALLTKEKKKTLKQTANSATPNDSGMTGMIKNAIDSMIEKHNNQHSGELGTRNTMTDSIISSNNNYDWSYNIYKEKDAESKSYDDLLKEDVLEQSVLSSLADDIKISMRNNKLRIRILVKNIDKE